ncbi:SDR family oxidoreductase [Paracoccus sp. 1_MG-2023]|uniref:SDR family oxidoreductase n=1 Tax=unclassified Paracoccus (in: a-proteobacteria) TaxID=2688777 RepID=UPI001C0A0D52|nr:MULTISPECIES: SDR family oxidoreductase [unclassified Paracoccus (in: a-proteobacteria)]MBU2959051.1 SDR family oxidoreductase [Paracoccus sp. C2R09]MDO6669024.1 SDR family oxidoreductase [Paracoccus sp. 1_MG-2023]
MQTAIVTGAAQGIGRGIVDRLRTDGWRVAALDLDPEALSELPDDPHLLRVECDVGDEEAVGHALQRVIDWLAGSGLNLLVSNAGIANPVSGPIERLSLADWRAWQDSHVTGAFLMIRGCVPLLRKGQGSIVTMSSTRALQSEPDCEAYAAAKGALLSMSHALAISLGPDIRANCILPGWIETGPWQKTERREDAHHSQRDKAQHPVGRVGRVEDISGLVAWLASDDAGFVTGQHFTVDGGMTTKMIYAE